MPVLWVGKVLGAWGCRFVGAGKHGVYSALGTVHGRVTSTGKVSCSPRRYRFGNRYGKAYPEYRRSIESLRRRLEVERVTKGTVGITKITLKVATLTTSAASYTARGKCCDSVSRGALPVLFRRCAPGSSILLGRGRTLGGGKMLFMRKRLVSRRKSPRMKTAVATGVSNDGAVTSGSKGFAVRIRGRSVVAIGCLNVRSEVVGVAGVDRRGLGVVALARDESILKRITIVEKATPVVGGSARSRRTGRRGCAGSNGATVVRRAITLSSAGDDGLFNTTVRRVTSFPNNSTTLVRCVTRGLHCPGVRKSYGVRKEIVINFAIGRSKALDSVGIVGDVSPAFSRRTVQMIGDVPG